MLHFDDTEPYFITWGLLLMTDIREAFNNKAHEWEAYTQTAPGRLREELNWQYLLPHLPETAAHIVDVGSGTGGLALRLAQHGHQVHLLDLSEEMLEIAHHKALALNLENNLQFTCTAVEDWRPNMLFDVVVCHTLLEYVADVPAIFSRLVGWMQEGGLLSVVFVNQYAEPLTLALGKGKLPEAAASLNFPSSAADLFGVPRQLFTSQHLQDISRSLPLKPVASYGVRVIADYLGDQGWKEDEGRFAEVLQLEMALARRFPYRYMGRYGQVIYRKS